MNLSITYKKPIGNGIITCLNKKQALERSHIDKKNKGSLDGAGEDVAAAAVFLASPESSYITGQVIHVNGGLYMSS